MSIILRPEFPNPPSVGDISEGGASPGAPLAMSPPGEASIRLLCKTLEQAAKPRHPLLADIPIVTPGEQFMRECNVEFIRRCQSDRVTEMGPNEAYEFWERKR